MYMEYNALNKKKILDASVVLFDYVDQNSTTICSEHFQLCSLIKEKDALTYQLTKEAMLKNRNPKLKVTAMSALSDNVNSVVHESSVAFSSNYSTLTSVPFESSDECVRSRSKVGNFEQHKLPLLSECLKEFLGVFRVVKPETMFAGMITDIERLVTYFIPRDHFVVLAFANSVIGRTKTYPITLFTKLWTWLGFSTK